MLRHLVILGFIVTILLNDSSLEALNLVLKASRNNKSDINHIQH